jgi:hypothetical protein
MLAVVSASLATWAGLCDSSGVALWKSYVSVGVAVLLALAALTRHPGWAAASRVLIGAWMIAAPYLLGFADVAPTRSAYLLIGIAVMITSATWYTQMLKQVGHIGRRIDVAARAD